MAQDLTSLFTPFSLGRIALDNRFAMSPMGRAHATRGVAEGAYADYFARRVRGGTRLVLTGATAIDHPLADYDGTGPVFYGAEPLAAWRAIADAVHEAGGWFCPQLWHTGMARRTAAFPNSAAMGPSGLSVEDVSANRAPSGIAMSLRDLDDVRTAFAKGVTPWRVLRRHVLRNALLPIVTFAGLQLGQVAGGAVLIETVFAWPGIGRLMFDALLQRDYQLLLGVFLVTSATVIFFNILTDIAYRFVDPRIRVGGGAK